MISRVVFIGDLCRGDQAGNVFRLERLFSPVLKQLGLPSSVHVTDVNRNANVGEWGGGWHRSLASSRNPSLEIVDFKGAAVIGFEVPERDLQYLDREGIPWANFAIHPLRFLDDLYFEVSTSFKYDLHKDAADVGLIDLCVQSLRTRYAGKVKESQAKTLAIFGQAPMDRSVYFDDRFHRLDSYLPQLDELVKQHEKVLFKPHPYVSDAELDRLISERYGVTLCTDWDIYELFVAAGISTACAISSSVLTEVPYFGITAEFLEPRAKRYGLPISYRSLLDDQSFWAEAFFGRKRGNEAVRISQAVPANYLRRVFASWGYLTDESLLEQRLAERQSQLVQPLVTQAVARTQQAESHATQARAATTAAESRAAVAEARAATTAAESRAAVAEARAATTAAESRAAVAEARAATTAAESRAATAEARASDLEAALEATRKELHDVHQANHHHWSLAEVRHQQIQALLSSTSWRITAPIRWARLAWTGLPPNTLKRRARIVLQHAALYVGRRPRLKNAVLGVLHRFPRLKSRLLHVRAGFKIQPVPPQIVPTEIANLTPRARQIHADLKAAIERRQKEIG